MREWPWIVPQTRYESPLLKGFKLVLSESQL
jgi:hypothetical protein